MSFLRVYVHFVWTTKKRIPFLSTTQLRTKVWWHIFSYAKSKGIHVDFINGYDDHCHCLVSLKPHTRMDKIMFLLKGESSRWINKNKLLAGTVFDQFEWQKDYYAVSVNPDGINRVREYIKNQERHHGKQTLDAELDNLVKHHGFKKYP